MIKERYQPVLTSVWTDEKFIHFDSNTKLLWLYLLTCKHSNMIGLFYLPIAYILSDLNWDKKTILKPFDTLCREGLIEYDKFSQMLFLVNNLKHRKIENPCQAIGAKKVLDELPETYLFKAFSEKINSLPDGFHKGLERVSKGSRDPKPVTEACNRSLYPVTESESCKKPLSAQNADEDRFKQFWSQYPRKENCKKARQAFEKIKPVNGNFEKIMAALETQKESEQWKKDNGKFIPHPTTWLNGHRWEDEIKNDDGLTQGQREVLKHRSERLANGDQD